MPRMNQKPETRNQEPGLTPFIAMLSRHWKAMTIGTALALMATAAAIGLLCLSGWFLAASALAGLQASTAQVFNFFFPSVGVRLLALARTAARYGERLVTHEATLRILQTLRVWCYRRIEPLMPAGLRGLHTGDLLSRITTDIDTLDNLYLRVLSPSAVALLTTVAMVFFILPFNSAVAAVAGGAMALAGIGIPILARRLSRTAARGLSDRTSDLRTAIVECLSGLAALLSSGAERRCLLHLEARHQDLVANQSRMSRITGLTAALMSLISGLATVATLMIGVRAVGSGVLTGPHLAMITLAVMAGFDAVVLLPVAYQYLGQTRQAAARLNRIDEIQPPVTYPETSAPTDGGWDIDLLDVSFRYADGPRSALEHINLHIPAGRRLAIMGATGAGKSTLLHLLARFEDPFRGEIRLAGRPLTEFSEEDLRRLVCIIDQRAHIFNGTVRDNLILARPGADDEALANALAVVGLEEFIRGLPDGLETWVGEAGRLLSGGQARRLAIARAALSSAPVWILDEPTEGLDRETAEAMIKALLENSKGKTVILVTHQPDAVRQMDEIVILQQGRITACYPVEE